MDGAKRKDRAVTKYKDINTVVNNLIEDRNLLIFTLSNSDIIQIEALNKWSLEALHQLLLANNKKNKIEKKQMEGKK